MTPEDQQFIDEWTAELYHRDTAEPRRVPDGQRCIVCYVHARDGRISHTRTCPEFLAHRASNSSRSKSLHSVQADARERYDRFVAELTMRRPDRYDCPSCGARGDGHGLKVDLAGERILFHCFSCGGSDEILAAVGFSWGDLGRAAA